MFECDGKTALVTDASRGIGKAAAIALAKAGAQVLVHYFRGAAQAGQAVSEIRAFGGKADAIGASLSSPDGPQDLARKTRAIIGNRLDILILNCSSPKAAPLEAMTVDDVDSQLTSNVRAPLFVIQQMLPILGIGSSIVFTLAPPSDHGGKLAHVVTKGAIHALVPHLATALAARRIRVNVVTPALPESDGKRTSTSQPAATHAPGDAKQVALTITFLASDDSSWISGDTLGGDGPVHH